MEYRSIRDLFPEVDDPGTLEKIEALVEEIYAAGCERLVTVVRAVEQAYGPEAKELVHRAYLESAREKGRRLREAADGDGVQDFLGLVEANWAATHEMERVVDTETVVEYRFTRCLVVEACQRLGAPDIGFWFCEGDEPCLSGFNPDLRFHRTKTLMEGHDICDHRFSAE